MFFTFLYSTKQVFLEICLLPSTNWTTAHTLVLAPAPANSLQFQYQIYIASVCISDTHLLSPSLASVVFLPLSALACGANGLNLKGSCPD